MIEEYEDILAAYDRALHLNRIAGRKQYVVTGTVDGWAVRQLAELLGQPKFPISKTVH